MPEPETWEYPPGMRASTVAVIDGAVRLVSLIQRMSPDDSNSVPRLVRESMIEAYQAGYLDSKYETLGKLDAIK